MSYLSGRDLSIPLCHSLEIVSSGRISRGDRARAVAGSYSVERISTPKVPAFFVRPSQRTAEDHRALAEMSVALAQIIVGDAAAKEDSVRDTQDLAVPQQLGFLESVRRSLGCLIGAKL